MMELSGDLWNECRLEVIELSFEEISSKSVKCSYNHAAIVNSKIRMVRTLRRNPIKSVTVTSADTKKKLTPAHRNCCLHKSRMYYPSFAISPVRHCSETVHSVGSVSAVYTTSLELNHDMCKISASRHL